jgi:signal peptidase I
MMAGLVLAAAGACAAALLGWLRGNWMIAVVRGNSMAPTLGDGQRLLARRVRDGRCARGDIIVFSLTEEQLRRDQSEDLPLRIKRVAAVAGEPIPEWLGPLMQVHDGRVPSGTLVVSGDNPQSQGSRQLGFIDQRRVLGRVTPARRRT